MSKEKHYHSYIPAKFYHGRALPHCRTIPIPIIRILRLLTANIANYYANKKPLVGTISSMENSRKNGKYQNYEACRKNANRVATAWTTAQLSPAQRRKKKKRKPNVFHRIISSLFDAASAMWKQRNSDRHRRENGTNISVETKIDRKIRNLYGKKSSVMNDDVDTYYNVDINTRLNHSLQSKKDWII